MTREQVKEYLTNLAKEIAENRTFSSSSSMKKGKMSKAALANRLLADEKIDLYEVTSIAPKSIKVDGKEFKVILEVANENKLNSFAKGNSASEVECGITVEEQYFWDGTSSTITLPVQLVYNENTGKPVETTYLTLPYVSDIEDIEEEFNCAIDENITSLEYPMFVLTIEDVEELEMEKVGGINKTAADGYLVLKGINMKVERDYWNDETELWYGVPIEIQGYTIMRPLIRYGWKMNGQFRLDASGTRRYFSDVNKKDKWYADGGQDVRLMALGDDKKAMVIWEDDWDAGQIDRRCLFPKLALATGDVIRANTSNYDAWNLANNRIETHVELSTK